MRTANKIVTSILGLCILAAHVESCTLVDPSTHSIADHGYVLTTDAVSYEVPHLVEDPSQCSTA